MDLSNMVDHSSTSSLDKNYKQYKYLLIMKRILLIAILSLTAFLPITAQKFSVAYVDMQYILKNLPQYETANEQLNMISKRWQRDIDAAQQEAKVLAANYQTEQIFLSADMKERREAEILAKEQEVLELKRKYFGQDGEWYKKREALLKPIQDEIYNAIQDIANEKRYDVVKDRSSEPSLIYMSAKLDISDQVLEKLGAK
jgi:outer membrane protein